MPRLRSWWRGLFRRSRVENAMDDELHFHIESYVDDLRRSGVAEAEALRRARLEFGGVAQVKEECREANGLAFFENLFQDVRFAFRMMAKSRSTTAILLITLALGIGANTAVFTLINGLMLRSLPVDHPEQLFFFGNDQGYSTSSGGLLTGSVKIYSYHFFEQFRERNQSLFDGLTAMSSPTVAVRVSIPKSSEQPRRFESNLVDGNFFHVLGVNAVLGRVLVAEDDLPDKPAPVTVVSYHYWTERLGCDPQVVGKTLLIDGAAFTIVGVTPPEFYGVKLNSQPPDFWFPLNQQPFLMEKESWLKDDHVYWLDVMGRLKPGTDVRSIATVLTSQLQQMMSSLQGSKLSSEDERHIRESQVELVAGSTGISGLRDRLSPRLRVLAVLVILVLIITCLNTANLLLARATARQREMGVRLAMGAKRGRVMRQLLTESVLLAGIGGLAGLALAAWTTRLLSTVVFGITPASFSFKPDFRVLAFAFAVSLLSGIVFGLAPAFHSTKVDLNSVLKDQFRSGTSGAGLSRLTPAKLLVSSQVVVSLSLLMVAGLFVGSLRNLVEQDLGFIPDQVLTCRLDLAAAGYHKDDVPQLYTRLIERVVALPGVRSAALADAGMLGGSNSTSNISIEGYTQKPNEVMNVQHHHVTWNYLQTNGMTLLEGRDISSDDIQEAPHVTVVNQAFAERYFPGQSPIGHHFRLGAPFKPPGMLIVGVVKNSKYNSLEEKTPPLAFIPLLQEPFETKPAKDAPPYAYGSELNVRVAGDPNALSQSLRRAITELDSKIPVFGITSLSQRVSDSAHDARAIAQLSGFFGLLALVLASIGLYGVMAYNVCRRTREIGVRMAIGAQAYDVLRMVMRESLLVVTIGVVLGIPAALGMGRLISSQLYGLSARDPITLVLATLLLVVACIMASYLPARRAARVNPMVALRHE
ncbi:MAG TPA: ABC transporter permease [Candidatus Angelobacter sp.]